MPRSLTKNQQLVLDVLMRERVPMSAYTILEHLREAGLKAPPQVYRALTALCEQGRVHKLASLNRFVPCQHPGCSPQTVHAFAICDACERVSEIQNDALVRCLNTISADARLEATQSTVEIHGRCARCQDAPS